jgi:3-carboxy-cis,cis-muconate cycloisomerase
MGKIALDVALLSQTEVGEVAEPAAPGRGSSSTMPQKRNPAGSALVRACVIGVNAQAGVLLTAMSQEQERAAGAWQAEWNALTDALLYTSGAVAGMADVLGGLEVDTARMRANLAATRGLVMSEAVMIALGRKIGRLEAHGVVEEASRSAVSGGLALRDVLLADQRVTAELKTEEVDAALDPERYLGSAGALIDRALADYRSEEKQR